MFDKIFAQVIRAVIALLLTIQLSETHGANILALFPTHSPSHLIIEMAVVKALAEHGHNITVVTMLPLTPTHIDPKITHLQLKTNMSGISETKRLLAKANKLEIFKFMLKLVHSLSDGVAAILDDEVFLNLLHNDGNKFDLLLYGNIFADFIYGVAAHFNCPTILIWPNQPIPYILNIIGNPYETSYVSLPYVSGISSDDVINITFRLVNLFYTTMSLIAMISLEYSMQAVYDKHFPAERYPEYAIAKKNVSLILFCHHFSEKPIRALVPGLVEIGGIQLNEQPNELPQDIAKFLDDANEHGAIFFSLGTNVREEHLEPNTLKTIFNVLSKLPQKVIWKCDKISDVPGNSTNILYKIWLPQADILAHRNIRLFFTHGGKGGITEAQFYGVPMVVMPIFGDQPMNSVEVVHRGYGVEIENLHSMTEVDVQQAVTEVLTNSKYRLAVQDFSKLYRDRPMTAKQTAVYWVEYVIRNRGALHMQSPLKDLSFVQKHNLDVMLFFVAIVFVAIQCIRLSFKIIRKMLRKSLRNKLKTN